MKDNSDPEVIGSLILEIANGGRVSILEAADMVTRARLTPRRMPSPEPRALPTDLPSSDGSEPQT